MRAILVACVLATVSLAHADPELPLVDVDKTGVELTKEPPPFRRSYLLAGVEVTSIVLTLNLGGRTVGADYSEISPYTAWRNVKEGFVIDQDAFTINQLGHPIEGVAMFTASRSAGLSFWASEAFAFAGSLTYEAFMENEPPSIGDQIMTPYVGMMLGEPLHRFATAMLYTGYGPPNLTRRIAGSVIDPLGALNRNIYGDAWYKEVPPAMYAYLGVGATQQVGAFGSESEGAAAHFAVVAEHGLTGDSSFMPEHPMDHFELRASLDVRNKDFDGSIYSRGLLYGRGFRSEHGTIRGLGGLFAAYDFNNQERVRHSIAALGPGMTSEIALGSGGGYLQGTVAGYVVPWGAAGGVGEIAGEGFRDYHRGPGLAALVEAKLGKREFGEIRVASRLYEIAGRLANDDANELVSATSAGLRFQIAAHHAIGAEASFMLRKASYHSDLPMMISGDDRSTQATIFYAITTDQIIHK
ncbi:MAG TPA: DUF3943 domain-containing protein [Kofleriaceae bacterium]|jgi:hypothetical protein